MSNTILSPLLKRLNLLDNQVGNTLPITIPNGGNFNTVAFPILRFQKIALTYNASPGSGVFTNLLLTATIDEDTNSGLMSMSFGPPTFVNGNQRGWLIESSGVPNAAITATITLKNNSGSDIVVNNAFLQITYE